MGDDDMFDHLDELWDKYLKEHTNASSLLYAVAIEIESKISEWVKGGPDLWQDKRGYDGAVEVAKMMGLTTTVAANMNSQITHFAQRNSTIDERYMPQRDARYLDSRRLTLRSGTSNKQYIVRLYEVNGKFVVIAWNGRNEPGKHLTQQPKGVFNTRGVAESVFSEIYSQKLAEGYALAEERDHPALIGSIQASDIPTTPPRRRSTRIPPDTIQDRRQSTPKPIATPEPEPVLSLPLHRTLEEDQKIDEEVENILGTKLDEEFDFANI